MKVFVTGGSGFVGGHVIEALSRHHEVFAMARSERSAEAVRALGATPVRCALDTVEAQHLAGVDTVVHAAAYVEEWGPEEAYWTANVDGTRALLDAAAAAGAQRFLLVSTNATVFDRRGQRDIDEAEPYPEHAGFPYGASKAEAERLVLAADRPDFATLALRPCFVWGPRDTSVLPALRRMAEEGGFVWVDGGRAQISTTHVHNLVAAIERSLTAGVGGQAYFVADGDAVSVRDFLEGLAQASGFTLKGPSLPGPLVRGVARALEVLYRAVGARRVPPVTTMAAQLMSRDMTVRTDSARRDLGWTPVVDRASGLAALS